MREKYSASYAELRFAESMRYVRRYPVVLNALEPLLPTIPTPVRIIAPERDLVVPRAHGAYLRGIAAHATWG